MKTTSSIIVSASLTAALNSLVFWLEFGRGGEAMEKGLAACRSLLLLMANPSGFLPSFLSSKFQQIFILYSLIANVFCVEIRERALASKSFQFKNSQVLPWLVQSAVSVCLRL